MPKPDILDQSTTRVELDQRSRDARLRLEYVERLLVVRPLPKQSLLRRFLRCLRSRTRIGGQIGGRSMIAIASAGKLAGNVSRAKAAEETLSPLRFPGGRTARKTPELARADEPELWGRASWLLASKPGIIRAGGET
jgi:hypothetical protein